LVFRLVLRTIRSLLPFGGGHGLRRLVASLSEIWFGLLELNPHDARAQPIARSIGRPGGGGCGV